MVLWNMPWHCHSMITIFTYHGIPKNIDIKTWFTMVNVQKCCINVVLDSPLIMATSENIQRHPDVNIMVLSRAFLLTIATQHYHNFIVGKLCFIRGVTIHLTHKTRRYTILVSWEWNETNLVTLVLRNLQWWNLWLEKFLYLTESQKRQNNAGAFWNVLTYLGLSLMIILVIE